MKSKLFATNDLKRSETFCKDVKVLFDMEPATLVRLPEYALKAFRAPTRAETKKVYDDTAEALGLPPALLNHALDVCRFFLQEFAPKGDAVSDSFENLWSDLKELFDLPDEKEAAVRSFLEQSRELAMSKVEVTMLQRRHAQKTLPNLDAVVTSVDIRAVFDEDYKYEEDITQFEPRFVGTVPLGIVELTIDTGKGKKPVFFQSTTRSLQILIDHLVALQKQMRIAEENITPKES